LGTRQKHSDLKAKAYILTKTTVKGAKMVEFEEKLEAFLAKVGLTRKEYDAEYENESKKYTDNGLEAKPEIIFRMIKNRYSTSVKSSAVWYNAYFIGVDQVTDWDKKTYDEQVIPIIDAYKQAYGDEWVQYAMAAGEVNAKGEAIYNAGNCGQSWQYGKVIPKSLPKRKLYAIVTDEDGTTRFAIIYTTLISTFNPIPGRLYKFRAGKHKGEDIWEFNTTTVSRLVDLGEDVPYDRAIEEIEKYIGDIIYTFEDIYPQGAQEVILENNPKKLNIAADVIMITKISIVDPSKSTVNFVEVGDMGGDFDENVTFTMGQDLNFTMSDESIGVGIFVPRFKNDKETGGMVPSGRLIGFILNEKLTPIRGVEENTTAFESNFD